MSVSSHLRIDLAQYDRRIRTFIPHYDEMLDVVAALLPSRLSTIVDLGVGTGALARRCLTRVPAARLIGIDTDPSMLAIAARRLGTRAELVHGSFEAVAIPRTDAVVAALALHHLRTGTARIRLYRRINRALPAGGMFVSADCHPATHSVARTLQRRAWRDHLRRTYSESETTEYFRSWQREDVYTPLARELSVLTRCGFNVEVAWRRGMFAVVASRKS
jgi:trans-aconitate methyltransferase